MWKWKIKSSALLFSQRHLAEILLSLGAIGSAMEIYEQLELWEDAIACYQRLGKTEKVGKTFMVPLGYIFATIDCFYGLDKDRAKGVATEWGMALIHLVLVYHFQRQSSMQNV